MENVTGDIITAAVGFLQGIIVLLLGFIYSRLNRLDNKFDGFEEKCRLRHENVVHKEDWIRENERLCGNIKAAHRRMDGAGVMGSYEVAK